MELLLALIYVSFCVVIFKLFKIPVNRWSLSTAALSAKYCCGCEAGRTMCFSKAIRE
jgi:hypothetical protein